MQSTQVMILFLVAASVPAVSANTVDSNPLGTVIGLLDSLAAKVTAEGEAEAKAFAEFVEWCDDASKNTGFAITSATAKKQQLEATIAQSSGDVAASSSKIEDLAAAVQTSEADLKSATAIREKEAADFSASEAELVDAIDTLGRAVGVLSKEMAKNPAAFAQVDTTNFKSMMSSMSTIIDAAAFKVADKQKLAALVQAQQGSDSDDEEPGAPAAAVYKSQSGNIVEVLEDMKEKAEEQLSSLRKAEVSAAHNYAGLKQSLEDQMSADNKDLAAEKAAKASSAETKAVAEGDLAMTVKELANSKDSLANSNANCMQTAADHEATVSARKEELGVIAKAKGILSSTTGGAESQSYSMLQLYTRTDLANTEVVALVKKLAQEHHSAALAQLASRIAAVMRYGSGDGQDVFAKVKNLISDLIAKLEAEAQDDASEKAYCDEQIAKTSAKQDELEDDIEKLSSKIDQAAAKSAGLKNDVKELQGQLAALAKEQAEMDRIRAETQATYRQAKEDLELGLGGVRKALGLLRDYYGGASASAFVQQPAVPQHSQATGAGQSIIGMLEVVESDFAKDLTAEETEEADAAASYDKTSQANAVTKAMKEQDVKYLTQEFNGLDKSVAELSADRGTEQTELAAVNEYFGKIKERCIAKPEGYETRAARRAAEIAGLKEALSILENETAFVQRGKRGLRHGFLGA